MEIPGLGGMGPLELIKRSVKDFLADDMPTYASALAFRALFSLFPFILFLTALLGFLKLSSFFEWLQGIATSMVPAEAADLVNDVINGLQQQRGGLLSFGVAFALWIASAGVREIMNAMNVAYKVGEGRPAWKLYPLSVIYTIGIAAMIIAAAALLILGPAAMEWIARQVGLQDVFVAVWAWLRWPAAWLILTLAVSIILYVAPNIEQRFKLINPGALLTVALWILASVGFNYYVSHFADYNAMYGSIGAIIMLLFYMFFSAAVLLFGAEVNAVIARGSIRQKEPTSRKSGAEPAAPGQTRHIAE
jgi:membrane protein